jgi:hypothetical protein
MERTAFAADSRLHLHLTRMKLQPLAAVLLAVGLLAAIVTDGLVPGLWTKLLLAGSLPLNIVTALWLTRPRA